MKYLLNPDSPAMSFWKKLTDFIILNVLWVVGCLPVITIGTSTAAMHRCVMQYQIHGDIVIFKEFWKAYRQNFKQATGLFLIEVVAVCVLLVDIRIVWSMETKTGVLNAIWVAMLFVLLIPALSVLLPLQAQFDNGFFATLKKAWLMAVLHLPAALLVTAINGIPMLLAVFMPQIFLRSLVLWFLFGRVFLACLGDFILLRVFQKHTESKLIGNNTSRR